MGTRTPEHLKEHANTDIIDNPLDLFRKFYSDTASFGSELTIKCGLEFFGVNNMLFATDMPFGTPQEGGLDNLINTVKAIEMMELPKEIYEKIMYSNIINLIQR
jgi:hypothetical protein